MNRKVLRFSIIALWRLIAAIAVLWAVHIPLIHAEQPAPKYPESLRIAGVSYFVDGKAVFIGLSAVIAEQGWLEAELKKRGVKLEWYPAPNANVGAAINEAFASNRIDFAGYGDLPSIILNAAGVQTRVIVPSGRGSDTFLVVPVNSTAKSIDDLKGKRIAIHRGRPWEVPLIRLMESRGLNYKDFHILNINPEAGAAALAANNVEAIYTLTDAYLIEDRRIGKIIWSTKQAPPDWKMRAELWASKKFIDAYPELTQLVATAHIKAAYWAAQPENKEAMIKLNARNGAPESVYRREYSDDSTPWRERWSPLFSDYVAAHYQHTVAYALEKKLINTPLDSASLLDPRFVPVALKQLQLENFWGAKAVVHDRTPQR